VGPYTGLTVTVNHHLYVITGTVNSGNSYVEGFTVPYQESTAPIAGNFPEIPGLPIRMDPKAFSLGADPVGRFLFAGTSNPFEPVGIMVYQVDASSGKLTLTPGSPYSTNPYTPAFCSHPSAKFLYRASGNAVFGFTVDSTSGALTAMPG